MDAKSKAIIAHITIIGWIVALILNTDSRDKYSSFYIRQTLGLYIIWFALRLIPVIGWILSIAVFAFWLLSLIYSTQGEEKIIPFGEYFQEWFRAF
ncbi:MAG: hypothetical protein PF436_14305 [Prolixibacteraceae bacterium]|jgi:uncharacterized membrane protein|nr:hypothetical protein [Prolixibacteraceae bacterium]